MLLRLKIGLSSSDFVQNDKRYARNLTLIARMPEDRAKNVKQTLENPEKPSKPYTPVCVHL
eukprot:679645-Heterocapsa_arctica.AAC.1